MPTALVASLREQISERNNTANRAWQDAFELGKQLQTIENKEILVENYLSKYDWKVSLHPSTGRFHITAKFINHDPFVNEYGYDQGFGVTRYFDPELTGLREKIEVHFDTEDHLIWIISHSDDHILEDFIDKYGLRVSLPDSLQNEIRQMKDTLRYLEAIQNQFTGGV